ncbi:MAG: thermonuclease family protein [Candidatus Omnitrophica bacterium]|nr:thermonuclease family protein [Candidatus Omnitrophota bacterium]
MKTAITVRSAPSKVPKTYSSLRKEVCRVISEGRERARRAFEQEAVRTRWEVGRLIDTHVLLHKERAAYGESIILRLARDIKVHEKFLYYSLEFYRAYPIFHTCGKLGWRHYQELLSVNDKQERLALTKKAEAGDWTIAELHKEIRKNRGKKSLSLTPYRLTLTPKRGRLGCYRIVPSELEPLKNAVVLDLGFSNYLELPARITRKVKAGDFVRRLRGKLRVRKDKRVRTEDLYTYRAFIDHVIDGDTVWAKVELGFGHWTRQKLRLRGIDCPEIKMKRGLKAKRFLERELQKVPFATIATTKSDKYDRYLCDVFAGGVFINEILLREKLARVVLAL